MTTEFISTSDVDSYFVDKDTGAPLSGGYLQFWEDADRTTPKLVYQKQQIGADPVTGQPVYQFVPLPNPVSLSAVGTPQDDSGNNVTIYYFPYDANGNVQLYYIAVFNYLGVPEFVREGWPNTYATDNPSIGNVSLENQISNPQFVIVNFNASTGLTIPFTGTGTVDVEIAPDWVLQIVYGGTGNVVVNQVANAGSLNLPTNPPFLLNITPGANVQQLQLIQKLSNDPGIWSAPSLEDNGWVAANIMLGPQTTGVSIQYVPSTGAPSTILTATNPSLLYEEFSSSFELPPSGNTSAPPSGYVNIIINLPTSTTSIISSVQVLPTNSEISGVDYNQDTYNRQVDHLFNYYKDKLQFKPIPSYLVGWNFPLNPGQFFDPSVWPMTLGAVNKSTYLLDQTILFQSVDASITPTVDITGGLRITATIAGQHALVQYLPAPIAIEMLSRKKCVNISANGSVATTATVSLWYTKTSLPSTVASKNSIVGTLDANGYPSMQNGTWIPVPRSGLSNSTLANNNYTNAAQFTIPLPPTGAASFNQIPLNGWDMKGNLDINNALYFAIVVGTANLAVNSYIIWQDISCQDGEIPSVSAPKTASQTLQECQQYYWKTYSPGVPPGTATGTNNKTINMPVFYNVTSSSGFQFATNFEIDNPVEMVNIPSLTFYNLIGTSGQVFAAVSNAGTDIISQNVNFSSFWTLKVQGKDRAVYKENTATPLNTPGSPSDSNQGYISFQLAADGRLGQ